MQVERFQRVEDGVRVEKRTNTTDLADGSKKVVLETLEEVVPMKTKERRTQMLKTIPVEETVEHFGDDGSVETEVLTVPDEAFALAPQHKTKMCKHGSKDKQPDPMMIAMMSQLDDISARLTPPVVTAVETESEEEGDKVHAYYENKYGEAEVVVPENETSWSDYFYSTLGWVSVAAILGMIAWMVTH